MFAIGIMQIIVNHMKPKEDINKLLHTALTLEQAIELGSLELRRFYGDMNAEIKVEPMPDKRVKISKIDAKITFYTIWHYITQ